MDELWHKSDQNWDGEIKLKSKEINMGLNLTGIKVLRVGMLFALDHLSPDFHMRLVEPILALKQKFVPLTLKSCQS